MEIYVPVIVPGLSSRSPYRNKSKPRDKGVLKAVVDIIEVIAHELLGIDVWKQAEIDRAMVETLDGTKNEWCWSTANARANAISTTVAQVLWRTRCYTRTSRHSQASPLTGL